MYVYEEKKSQAIDAKEKKLKEKGVKVDDKAFKSKNEGEAEETPIKPDNFTTGHYIVGGIEYIYSDGDQALTQRLTLLRREWPTRANNL